MAKEQLLHSRWHRLQRARKTFGVSGYGAFSECKRTRQSARRAGRNVTKEESSFSQADWVRRRESYIRDDTTAPSINSKRVSTKNRLDLHQLRPDIGNVRVESRLLASLTACATRRQNGQRNFRGTRTHKRLPTESSAVISRSMFSPLAGAFAPFDEFSRHPKTSMVSDSNSPFIGFGV